MTKLSIAVVSDVHAEEFKSQSSHVISEPPNLPPNTQPLSDLFRLVDQKKIRADYLIAPGDLTNQANPVGLAYAWRMLNELASLLGAQLVGVPGNHDVVTHVKSRDPRGLLKNLSPSMPFGDSNLDSHFWEKGWSLIEQDDHRILAIDSTIGFPKFPDVDEGQSPTWQEYCKALDRGSFPEQMEQEITSRLLNLEPKLNIAILHHHPMEHQFAAHLKDGYGPMYRGSELIALLSRNLSTGRWFIIHGHKHIPQLTQATTATSNGPLVLCAASLGGKLWSPVNTVTRNQFHRLEVSNDSVIGVGSIQGTVESFAWGYGLGWNPSERIGVGLPQEAGFGCVEDFRQIASSIVRIMDENRLHYITYSDLRDRMPQLPYLLPIDLENLEQELNGHGLEFVRNRENCIAQLTRP